MKLNPKNLCDELSAQQLILPDDLVLADLRRSELRILVWRDFDDVARKTSTVREGLHICGRACRIEYQSTGKINGVIAKLDGNLKNLPGLSTLLKTFQALGIGVFDPDVEISASLRAPRLCPVEPSGPVTSYFADLLSKDTLRRSRGSGKFKARAETLSDAEFQVLESLASWSLIHGAEPLRRMLDKLHVVCVSLQITLVHMVCLQRILEDVNGMVGARSASAVLLCARAAFQQLARAQASIRGMQIGGEADLLEWAARQEDLSMHEAFKTGFFPNPEDADQHLTWLRVAIKEFVDYLNRNWLLKLALRHISRIVKSDISDSDRLNIPDEMYHPPRMLESDADVKAALAQYMVESKHLLSLIPAIQDTDSVLLVGSIADGLGHFRSDVDMLVFTQDQRDLSLSTVSLSEGQQECYCGVTQGGHSICASFITEELLQEMDAWLVNLAGKVALGSAAATQMDREEVRKARNHPWARLLYRAKTGIPLRVGTVSQRWLGKVPLATFSTVMACSHFLEYRNLLSTCRDMEHGPERLIRCRTAYEHLLYGLLSSKGKFYWTKRWIPEGIFRLGDAGLTDAVRKGLFPEPDDLRYFAWVEQHGKQVTMAVMEHMPDLATWIAVPTSDSISV